MRWKVLTEKLVIVAFLVLGVFTIKLALGFGYSLFGPIEFNPGIVPVLLGILLIVLAMSLIILDFFRKKEVAQFEGKFTVTAPIIVVSAAVYTLFLPIVGFLIATPLWVISVLIILKAKVKVRIVILFCGIIVLTYLIFWKFLPTRLPSGFFFD